MSDFTTAIVRTELTRPSGVRTLTLGDLQVTYVPDGSVQLRPDLWFPGSRSEDWEALSHYLDTEGYLVASVGGLLVETGERALLIDTGFGPNRIPSQRTHPALGVLEGGGLPAGLRGLGRDPATIDTVAFTHLHDDHVGWATHPAPDGSGPFLPNARLVASEQAWRSWAPLTTGQVDTSFRKRVLAFGDGEFFPGVRALRSPGHAPGHTCFEISSGDRRLVVLGDAMHSPLQVSRPSWHVSLDQSPRAAVDSRLALLEELARTDTLGFAGHFADVVFGSVSGTADQRRWEPLPE